MGAEGCPSLSNYDAVVVDLEAVSLFVAEVIRGVKHRDRSGLPISPSGDGNVAGEVPIAELLQRRKREADTLLQNGGVLICFAHPSVNHRINRANWFIYDWLPSIASDSYHPRSIAAGDGEIGKADSSHPFTRYFSAFSGRLEYKVFFNQIFIDAHPGVKIIAQARSGEPVAVEVEDLHLRGVEFRSLSEDFDTSTATGKLQLQMVLAFSEWWRNSIRDRSVAGQAKARAGGRFPGRRPSLTAQQRDYIRVERSKGVSQRELAKLLEVSRWTIQQVDR